MILDFFNEFYHSISSPFIMYLLTTPAKEQNRLRLTDEAAREES